MKFCHLLWLLQPTVLTSFQNFPPETRLCSHRNGKLSVDLNDLNHRSDSQRGALALAVEQLPVNPWGSLRWHRGSAGCAALGKKVRIPKKFLLGLARKSTPNNVTFKQLLRFLHATSMYRGGCVWRALCAEGGCPPLCAHPSMPVCFSPFCFICRSASTPNRRVLHTSALFLS